MDLHMPQSGARVHNELKSDVSPCSSWVESAVWTSASHFRFTPISRPLQSDTGLRIGGNKGSFSICISDPAAHAPPDEEAQFHIAES